MIPVEHAHYIPLECLSESYCCKEIIGDMSFIGDQ